MYISGPSCVLQMKRWGVMYSLICTLISYLYFCLVVWKTLLIINSKRQRYVANHNYYVNLAINHDKLCFKNMESINADENVAYGLSIGLGLNQVSEVKYLMMILFHNSVCMHGCHPLMMKCNMNWLIWLTLYSLCPLILHTLPSLTDSLCTAQLIQVKPGSSVLKWRCWLDVVTWRNAT